MACCAQGEATISRQRHEVEPRKDAQERVFGDRKRSVVTVSELRGLANPAASDGVLSRDASDQAVEAAEAARRVWEKRMEAFDKTLTEWIALQKVHATSTEVYCIDELIIVDDVTILLDC